MVLILSTTKKSRATEVCYYHFTISTVLFSLAASEVTFNRWAGYHYLHSTFLIAGTV